MNKLKLIILIFFSLLLQQSNAELNCSEYDFSVRNFSNDKLNFESNTDFNYLAGILPYAQIFFNIVPEVPVSFPFNAKTKNPGVELFTSKTKINFNHSFYPVNSFSRYSSTVVQIFLRTACFRL